MTSPPGAAVTPSHRLPDGTRVGGVRLQVRVLGLAVLDRWAGNVQLGVAGLAAPPLVSLVEKPGIAPVPSRGTNGLFHFAVLLPTRADLGRFLAHVVRAGVRFGAADHLVSEALYLHDPDGLGIEVYADRPRASWRYSVGELVMSTEAIDAAGLVDAAGGERWHGVPAGTTMGHMHLHVGDLGRARDFYAGALGFDVNVSRYPGALFLSAGGYHHHLGTNTWGADVPSTDTHARLLDWTLLLPESDHVSAVVDRLRRAGSDVSEADAGHRTADPWGTALVLHAEAAGIR